MSVCVRDGLSGLGRDGESCERAAGWGRSGSGRSCAAPASRVLRCGSECRCESDLDSWPGFCGQLEQDVGEFIFAGFVDGLVERV